MVIMIKYECLRTLIKITYRHWDHFVQKSRNTAIPGRAIKKNSEAKLYYWYYLWLTFNGLVVIWVTKSYAMGQDCLVILPLWIRQFLPDWMHKLTSFCRKIHGIAWPYIYIYVIGIFRDTSWRSCLLGCKNPVLCTECLCFSFWSTVLGCC